jgi:hypothetical protein
MSIAMLASVVMSYSTLCCVEDRRVVPQIMGTLLHCDCGAQFRLRNSYSYVQHSCDSSCCQERLGYHPVTLL